jgi:hypothetical protein
MAHIAVCDHVEDGDTLKTSAGEWIRLANVCTPEKGRPAWETAKRTLESLVLHKSITVEPAGTSYGRVVANVRVGNIDVNQTMRNRGYTCS